MSACTMGSRAWRGMVATCVAAATVLVLSAQPASACSCGPAPAPAVHFTGIAIEDLGYLSPPTDTGPLGEVHTWLLDVEDAFLGVEQGQVRISMVVGRVQSGDSFAVNGCGMDDNLVIGERYEVVSGGLERMISCGSSVVGPRAPVPDRSDDSGGITDGLLALAAGGAALLLVGIVVVVARRRSGGPL